MRLVTFLPEIGSGPKVGVMLGDRIVDIAAGARRGRGAPDPRFESMLALICAGPDTWSEARALAQDAKPSEGLALEQVKLLAPLPRPEQIRCFSAFEEHGVRSAQVMLREIAKRSPDPSKALAELAARGPFKMPKIFFERPLYYKGNRFSVIGPGATTEWPRYSQVIDFELELACVIGKQGKDISQADAHRHIFGYTACNDLSARDEQAIEMQAPLGPAKGKDFDGGLCMGPCIVTADEFRRDAAEMIVRVNGEEWSRGHAMAMHHTFERMIEYVSRSETIYPGEVFLSGCVGGGSGVELERYPRRGDLIELEIVGIGRLPNRIG